MHFKEEIHIGFLERNDLSVFYASDSGISGSVLMFLNSITQLPVKIFILFLMFCKGLAGKTF